MNLLRQWLRPDVSLRRSAQGAIDEAFWVCLAIVAYHLFFALLLYLRPGGDIEASLPWLLEGILFAALAIGIRFRSRVACVLAFILFTCELFYFLLSGRPAGLFVALLASLALFAGVRGAFAYHSFPKRSDNLPSLADSFRSVKGPSDT